MERVRAVGGRLRPLVAAAAAAALGSGCVSAQKVEAVQKAMKEVVAAEKPAPATEFACGWQNRLATLPDPTRGGATVPGVVGQVFLYTAEYQPAEAGGDLTVTVHDTTPRPPGAAGMRPEAWHFTRDVLAKMVVSDERFGRSLVVFLPWPEGWRDVNRLSIQARYDQPGGHTLYAQPTTVTLDFSAPTGGGPNPAAPALPTVPDPGVLLKQARAAAVAQPPPGWPPAVYGPPQPTAAPVQHAAYPPPAAPRTPAGPVLPPNELLVPR